MLRVFLILLLVLSCGKKDLNKQDLIITKFKEDFNKDLDKINDNRFNISILKVRVLSIKVIFRESSEDYYLKKKAGYCYYNKMNRFIVIDKEYKTSIYLKLLLYHELGHCILELDHYEKNTDVMNSILSPFFINPNLEFMDRYFNIYK